MAQRFDIWLKGLKLGDKVNNLLSPIKSKFNPDNVKLFKEGFSSGSMASVAKDTILNAEKATAAIAEATKGAVDPSVMENLTKTAAEAVKKVPAAKETLASLEKVSKMGALGKTFGKAGLFLRKNLTGLTGIFNGLFAAMTINGVIQAKKGEKVSTLMEDLLGTWIGSLGGFRLFDAALKGLAKVNAASTASGILPTIAKVVNKIPAKGFLIPLAGAMILSNVLQKVSHKIFGKPTKNDPKVIESAEDFQKWRQQTGWTQEEFNAARQVS